MKQQLIGCLAACLVIATSSAAIARQGVEAVFGNPTAQKALIIDKIKDFFPEDYRTMIAIANCESTGLIHWQSDGSLRPNDSGSSSAAGVFQVLLKLHGPDIKRMGLDMNDVDDYMRFVRWLYDRPPSRFSDWKQSRSCWASRIAQQ